MKTYSQYKEIHPCKLNKEDLLELVRIIKKGFPKSNRNEDFQIWSKLSTINIDENDINEFFKYEEIPNIIDRLSIRQIGWNSEREIDKVVDITFYTNYINLDVRGFNEEWVLGKLTQIQNFLKNKRTRLFFLNYSFPYLVGLLFLWSIFMVAKNIKNFNLTLLTFSTLFLISIIILTILFSRRSFLPYTKIIINQKKLNKESIII